MRRGLLLFISLFVALTTMAQELGIGYWNVDALYDTIPSRFYDDVEYTPKGRFGWNSERYLKKIEDVAAVLDSMTLPIVGLFGVETEAVVRDILKHCHQDYCYIHQTRNSLDGLDFALLYFGDIFFPISVDSQRNLLSVAATYGDKERPITIILTRSGSDLCDYIDESIERDEFVVALGNIYQRDIRSSGYTNLMSQCEKSGSGNYRTLRGWLMRDRAATNQADRVSQRGVFIAPWLLTPNREEPLPTFNNSDYIGGFSRYLPIYLYLH